MVKAVVAGVVGGAIGAAIWTGVTYFTAYEIGWVAWGVGVLAGLGVRLGAGDADGWTPGILAAVIALLAVVAGKYAVVAIIVNQHVSGQVARAVGATADPEERAILALANEVAREQERRGESIHWPPAITGWEVATHEHDYPTAIWSEAQVRWGATPACYRSVAMDVAMMASRECRITYMGHLICEQSGGYAAHRWPDGVDPQWAFVRDDFTEELWRRAEQRYDAMDEPGHQQFAAWASDWITRRVDAAVVESSSQATNAGFSASFRPLDVLWFALAIMSAFKLGSGMASAE